MTLSIGEIRKRIPQRFSDLEQVEDSVLRFTRRFREQTFAVYYVDVSPSLPSTSEALTDYQDRVIGRHYFDGRKSLQWSNYLYFVVSDEDSRRSDIRDAKKLIELDRTYVSAQ